MTDKASVLFVDDEERVLRSLEFLFRPLYTVYTTTDVHKALELLKEKSIQVLVSDQRMPIMQGVELLRLAKEVSPNTMRLLLTGYSDIESILGSVNEGEIFRYISKPWSNEDIKEKVGKAADIGLEISIKQNALLVQPDESSLTNVLVIDEDPATYALMLAVAKSQPYYRIFNSKDLEHALDILKKEEIHLVISEIFLSKQDISFLLKILKQKYPEIVTLVTTSFRDKDSIINLINQAQVFRFLPKPLLKSLLEISLSRAAAQYHSQKIQPDLVKQHIVEPSQPPENNISKKILNYFRNLSQKIVKEDKKINDLDVHDDGDLHV